MRLSSLLLYAISFLICTNQLLGQIKIHAHNDYQQAVPFWQALSFECASIEVDLILRGDTLFVAHEEESIKAVNTFDNLYLQPIQRAIDLDLIKRPFALLIDLKTDAIPTLDQVIT